MWERGNRAPKRCSLWLTMLASQPTMDSSSVDAEFKAARDLHSAGRWPEASQRFEALMKRMRTANTLTPERERALVDLLVSCYRSMSEHGKALPLAQRSVELTLALRGPTSEMYPASRLAVGHAYTGLGRFKEASRETQAVLTIFEERGDGLIGCFAPLAVIAFEVGVGIPAGAGTAV